MVIKIAAGTFKAPNPEYPTDISRRYLYPKQKNFKRNYLQDQTMDLKEKSDAVLKILKKRYPDVKTQLNFETPFQLLTATILSAQCTDKQVNTVTGSLFKNLSTPEDFANIDLRKLEELIRPTGYFRNKAKSIQNCAKALNENHGGEVPGNMNDLVKLPGVGRKTANVILGAAFGVPGITVDTHVSRLSQRIGLTSNKDAVKIEHDLMKLIPEEEWIDFSLRLIYFGREICRARRPLCAECPVYNYCDFPDKTG